MSPTNPQLSRRCRKKKVRRNKVAAFAGAPQRRGIIYQIAVTSPRKPNSARRTYAKIRLAFSLKRIFAKIPGIGDHYLQAYSVVFVRGQGPKDTPGVNYHLVRGVYDFNKVESYGRRKRRSKFGTKSFV